MSRDDRTIDYLGILATLQVGVLIELSLLIGYLGILTTSQVGVLVELRL